MPKIISISAKCSDLFSAQLIDKDSEIESRKVPATIIGEYDGYVPAFFPGEHYGDYVQLDIDIETGQILNWKKPTKKDLEIFE